MYFWKEFFDDYNDILRWVDNAQVVANTLDQSFKYRVSIGAYTAFYQVEVIWQKNSIKK